ncbi:MAG: SCO family protein [Pseudomonadota bacterium]
MRAALAAVLLAGAAGASDIPAPQGLPLPFDFGGAFALTDHTGATRTQADPEGRMQLVFFGYANCEQICSVALPLMADVAYDLADRGLAVTPVMITVDPARDTVADIGPPLAEHHPDFVGLTGSEDELAPVYDLFAVEHKLVWTDPEYGPLYAHGSHIYLMDAAGAFLTLIPPILSPERATEIVAAYAG